MKSEAAVVRYLGNRDYHHIPYENIQYYWHLSEAAALKNENLLIKEYEGIYGELPLYNLRRGGGGRQRYYKCKAYLSTGLACRNDALASNYGFCGIHRS